MSRRGNTGRGKYPIKHWSHSSLMAFLRNPLAWYKRYVEKIYDTPASPSGVIGRAAHVALQHFYGGIDRDGAVALGLEYLRKVPDEEIHLGTAESVRARREKRAQMEAEYVQAIGFYLEKPPRHAVVGVEVSGLAKVPGIPLPIKAISDLVVESKAVKGALDIVDHKFVESFSKQKGDKTLFVMQALFNYYTVSQMYGRPVHRFIVQECRKKKNRDGSPQMRRYTIEYAKCGPDFTVFHRLLKDATAEIGRKRLYLPNPSDLFEGEHSFDVYRLDIL